MTVSAGPVPSPPIPRPRAPHGGRHEAARVRFGGAGTHATSGQYATDVCCDAPRPPAAAGLPLPAGLLRTPPGRAAPALRAGRAVWPLIAEGAAEEVPDLLHRRERGTPAGALGPRAVGDGTRVPAPGLQGGHDPRETAAVWLRPPAPGREGGRRSLPATATGAHPDGAPDLARLVEAAAAGCHRALLRRQPLAFS